MTLRELLSVRPPEDQVRDASRRARLNALAGAQPRQPRLALLATLACAGTAALLLLTAPAPPEPSPAKPPLTVNMTLTDGTRVVWTFDDGLQL